MYDYNGGRKILILTHLGIVIRKADASSIHGNTVSDQPPIWRHNSVATGALLIGDILHEVKIHSIQWSLSIKSLPASIFSNIPPALARNYRSAASCSLAVFHTIMVSFHIPHFHF